MRFGSGRDLALPARPRSRRGAARPLAASLCLAPGLSAAAAFLPLQADRPEVRRLHVDEPWPSGLATRARSLASGGEVAPGGPLAPGAWVVGRELWFVRDSDGAAGHARSFIGMPVAALGDGADKADAAHRALGYDPLTLVIHAWRLADRFPWPWYDAPTVFGGLGAVLDRHNPTAAGFALAHGVYGSRDGPVVIGPEGLSPGDLLAAGLDDHTSVLALLVADAGVIGRLDPADRVVTCQTADGGPAAAVYETTLASLFGPAPLHAWSRSREKAQRRLDEGRLRPDNPIWGLPPERQFLALLGMVIIVVTLLRWRRVRIRR